MICYLCGRRIKRAAATKTLHETDPPVTVTGYAGRTCARKAGLLRRRVVARTAKKVQRA